MTGITTLQFFTLLSTLSSGYESLEFLPSSCAELSLQGNRMSGVYTIHPRKWFNPTPFKVFCDMETNGGGWTVFQRRDDFEIREGVRENFTRNWTDYKNGFGDLKKEFWLGNDFLYILTNQDRVELRVDLQDFDGNSRVAEYTYFQITNEKFGYKLTALGYHGDAGDSIASHNAHKFITFDKDNVHNCSATYKGGWWYGQCHQSNLNGKYLKGKHGSWADGVNWFHWLGYQYSLKRSEMKIRPILDDYYHSCYFNGCQEVDVKNENTNVEQLE